MAETRAEFVKRFENMGDRSQQQAAFDIAYKWCAKGTISTTLGHVANGIRIGLNNGTLDSCPLSDRKGWRLGRAIREGRADP